MKCPKCGTENPDGAQTCNLCACVLGKGAGDETKEKPKISRLAIASLVLSIFGLLTFLITALLSIALGITSLFRIKKHKGELKGTSIAITGIAISAVSIIVFLAILVLWNIDAPLIPDDYTIAVLRSAPPECAHSYDLLIGFAYKGESPPEDAPEIGLSAQDVNTIYQINDVIKEGDYSKITEVLKANKDSINRTWQNAKKGRDAINELNTFPEIADLTEPDLDAEMKFLRNLRLLAYLYQAHVYLQADQGNSRNALNELIKLDSVFGKLSVNARSIVTKLVCFAGLNVGIRAANFIANNHRTSQKSLQLLAEHFMPLTKEQVSLRNSVISEYLMFKKMLDTQLGKEYSLPETPFLKRNSILRLCKNYYDNWINVVEEYKEPKKPELSVWPSIYPNWIAVSVDSEGKVPWVYTAYNPIGSILIRLMIPAFEKVFEIQTKLKVHDDLFQIVLNKRLGNEVSLKARAYSDEYIIDVEGKKIYSPGPDGIADTEDDIRLPINPKVLGL